MEKPSASAASPAGAPTEEAADRLHSLAIHLLRAVRREDDASGVTAPHLSALSVLVFGGARTIGELAGAEQVRAPSMTRIVDNLERGGLALRERDPRDARRVRVRATDTGVQVLREGRARRIAALAAKLAGLTDDEMDAVRSATAVLERVLRG
ncbi:MAG: regulatory protein MarR [Gemmatimonadetes bacterium]|nr:regulatory protein MarR [Gemmatimonadota bacterium]